MELVWLPWGGLFWLPPWMPMKTQKKNIKIVRLKTKPYRKSIDKIWEQSQDTIRLRVLGQNNPVLLLIGGIVLPRETENMTQRTWPREPELTLARNCGVVSSPHSCLFWRFPKHSPSCFPPSTSLRGVAPGNHGNKESWPVACYYLGCNTDLGYNHKGVGDRNEDL